MTVEDFAGYLRRSFDQFDAYTAQLMLDGAEGLVTEYAGWHIAPSRDETVTVDGSGATFQTLPTLHLTAVAGITEDGVDLDPDDITWSTYGVLEKRSGARWTGSRRGLTVDISHGFPATPAWLSTMVCAVAGRAFLGSLGVVQEAAGGESASYAQPFPGAGGAVVLLAQEKATLGRLSLVTA